MFNLIIVTALVSVSCSAPTPHDAQEDPIDLDNAYAGLDASGLNLEPDVPFNTGVDSNNAKVPSDDVDSNSNYRQIQPSATDFTPQATDLGRRSLYNAPYTSFIDCIDVRYPVDPYFDPYFRLRMRDPLYRRWLQQRKCAQPYHLPGF